MVQAAQQWSLPLRRDRLDPSFAGDTLLQHPDVLGLLALVGQLNSRISELEHQKSRLQGDYRHLEEQIEVAGRMQREMLPEAVALNGVTMHSLYRPMDYVGGDVYDVVRLDAAHVGFTLVDVSGHGMPAALLTALLRKSFRAAAMSTGHTPDPVDVLQTVNRELNSDALPECQFVSALYGIYDEQERTFTFGRAGNPYPILIRRDAAPKQLVSSGPILGALDRPAFESMTVYLEPGDRLLLFTDGLEALLCERHDTAQLDCIAASPWFAGLASGPVTRSLGAVDRIRDESDDSDWPADDITILALEIG